MRRSTRRRLVRLLRSAAIALVLALVLCEIGLRALRSGPPTNAAPTAKIIPYSYHYAHSPYWSDAFAHGFHQIFSKGVPNLDNEISLGTVSATGYTIINNERVTTDQPVRFARTVWLYGSSSIWGAYVADGWTIASYLQREYNRRGIPWRVRNMAQPGINSTLEYYWLTQSDVRAGDLVLFIDGGVEMYYTVDYAYKLWKGDAISCKLREYSALATYLCEQYRFDDTPQGYIDAAIKTEFAHYWRDIDKAKAWAAKRGAGFVHFMQPTTYDQWSTLYRQLSRGDIWLTVNRTYHIDDLHYDDDGHASLAAQIAAVVTAF